MRKDTLLNLISDNINNPRAKLLKFILDSDDTLKTLPPNADIQFETLLHSLQMFGVKLIADIPQQLRHSPLDGDLFFWYITGKLRPRIHPESPLEQSGLWDNIAEFCDIKRIANLSACSSTLYSYKQKWLEKKIMALGYNEIELKRVMESQMIKNYQSFYNSLTHIPLNERKKCVAWEMYCLSGQLDAIKHAIKTEKLNAECRGINDRNPLHYAAKSGSVAAMQCVIARLRINPTLQSDDGAAILHYAAMSGNIDALQYVINDLHADKNQLTHSKSTLLHSAAKSGNIELIKYVLSDLNVALDIVNVNKMNALHFAVLAGKLKAVKYFIEELHFDKTTEATLGRNILHFAALSGSVEVMKYIINNLHFNKLSRDKYGRNILHYAVMSGCIEAIQYVLQVLKIPKDSLDEAGKNCLHYASLPETFEFIINKLGIPLLSVDDEKMNVLQSAAFRGDVEAICYIRLLSLQRKLTLNSATQDNLGRDAFYYATRSKNPGETMRALELSDAELIARAQEQREQAKTVERCVLI